MAGRRWGLLVLLVLLLLCHGLPAMELSPGQVIRVCDDGAEWPPFLYFKRANGIPTQELTGYSYEFLKRLLDRRGLKFSLTMLTWNRCMAGVANGRFDMLLNASTSAEREAVYWVSQPYYALSMVYFFDKSRPEPVIKSLEDLHRLRACGVLGYNYAPLGYQNGSGIDTEAMNFPQVFEKLKKSRCDVVPERLEPVLGFKLMGVVDVDALGIGYRPIPGTSPSPFHMMVSRQLPYSESLIRILDQGIGELVRQHKTVDLARKYGLPNEDLDPAAWSADRFSVRQ